MTRTSLIAAALALFAAPVFAEGVCPVEGDRWDLDEAGVDALYACMKDRLAEGYGREGHPIGSVYRDWNETATRAAVTGPHSERFLLTFVNDIAAEQYLKYEEGDFEMPVGSILAKESIGVREGEGRVGPLLIMTKVDDRPETDNWLYTGVQPNGKELKVSQSFCHDCHSPYEASDSMGYPGFDVRLTAAE